MPLCLLLTFASAAGALGFSGSVVLAQLAGALSACLGVFVATALWRPDLPLLERAHVPTGIALAGLLTIGMLFSELPLSAAAILAALPQVARLPGGDRAPAAFLRGIVVVFVGALAVWLSLGDPDPYSEYY